MERGFNWLQEKHGDESRNILERICLHVFESEFLEDDVQDVKPSPGDDGIDVFINHQNGNFTVIQCKFYLDSLTSSRKSNISKSYNKAIKTKEDTITKWILCTPKVFTNKEHNWWGEWKEKRKDEFEKKTGRNLEIGLLSGNKFMKLIKKHKLYEEYFEVERVDKHLIDKLLSNDEKKRIHDEMYKLIGVISSGDYIDEHLIMWIDQVEYLSCHRFFNESDIFHYLNLLSQLIAFESGPKDIKYQEKEFEYRKKIIEEYKKLNL
ncbi:hypothetical protein [Exiguobacterium sp. s183]|uniref:restriction endonuclease n=1 Tax=Exiguobacterium sp. s183 TaxID=2751262 RepID=UPI001BE9B6FF|nr:hypothetical protein [Exiguobacterium sp. s183]